MINQNKEITLIDFGLSKIGKSNKLQGTEYYTPFDWNKDKADLYGCEIDLYATGILIF